MTVLPFTAMDAISGFAGSSENCALQGRPALSFQVTRTASAVELMPMESGTGPVTLKGTAAAMAMPAAESRTMIDFTTIDFTTIDFIMIQPQAPLQCNASVCGANVTYFANRMLCTNCRADPLVRGRPPVGLSGIAWG